MSGESLVSFCYAFFSQCFHAKHGVQIRKGRQHHCGFNECKVTSKSVKIRRKNLESKPRAMVATRKSKRYLLPRPLWDLSVALHTRR